MPTPFSLQILLSVFFFDFEFLQLCSSEVLLLPIFTQNRYDRKWVRVVGGGEGVRALGLSRPSLGMCKACLRARSTRGIV